jgi:hypothetical protein
MNRLSQNEPTTFQFCRVWLSLGILFFSILQFIRGSEVNEALNTSVGGTKHKYPFVEVSS